MSEVIIRLPRHHSAQSQLDREASRFNVVNCGRRFGKTKYLLRRACMAALQGKSYGWFAPNYKYLLGPMKEIVSILSPVTSSKNLTDKRIELKTGGVIDFWTCDDPDAGRSRAYHEVAVDEAAMVKDLQEMWGMAIRPTLADHSGGAWFASTPKGMGDFYELWAKGQAVEEPEWKSWTMPTSANPYIDAGEIENARRGLPERIFGQEYLASFIEESGGVFRGVSAVIDPSNTGAGAKGPFSMGVDLARVEDFTVITVLDSAGRQVYHDRFNQISWERMIAAVQSAAGMFPECTVTVDATGVGDPVYERIRAVVPRAVPFKFTSQSKEAVIDNLAMQIEQGQLSLMDIPIQTAELMAYAYEVTAARNIRMNAPSGKHDDCVIALALAAWGMRGAEPFFVGLA
jgi:hypothetical protein